MMKDLPSLRALPRRPAAKRPSLVTRNTAPTSRFAPTIDIGTCAYWFIPIVGVTYAAGFLIVFWSSKTFGIDTVELFHGKYIHVGGLCAMGFAVIALPIFWIFRLKLITEKTQRWPWAAFFGSFVYSAMLFTFYVVTAFAERGFLQSHPWILFNFLAPCLYSVSRLAISPPTASNTSRDRRNWISKLISKLVDGSWRIGDRKYEKRKVIDLSTLRFVLFSNFS